MCFPESGHAQNMQPPVCRLVAVETSSPDCYFLPKPPFIHQASTWYEQVLKTHRRSQQGQSTEPPKKSVCTMSAAAPGFQHRQLWHVDSVFPFLLHMYMNLGVWCATVTHRADGDFMAPTDKNLWEECWLPRGNVSSYLLRNQESMLLLKKDSC